MAVKVDCKFIVYNIKPFYLFLPLPLSQASPKKGRSDNYQNCIENYRGKRGNIKTSHHIKTQRKHKNFNAKENLVHSAYI